MIKRNKDGQQNINDLRQALESRDDVSVHREGGNWIIGNLIDGAWHQSPAPYYFDERAAIQKALFGEAESKDEARYHAGRQK